MTSALRTFDPVFNSDEERFLEAEVPVRSTPFNVQLIKQEADVAVTEKAFEDPTFAILTLAVFGDLAVTLQSSPTLACQEQTTVSKPSDTVASTVRVPTKPADAVRSDWLAVVPVIVSTSAPLEEPSIVHEKLRVSPASAAPLTVKACELDEDILRVPVEGEILEQLGGVFFVTVHS